MLKHRQQNTKRRRAFHRMCNRNLKWLGLPPETQCISVDIADALVWDYPVLAIYAPANEDRCRIFHYGDGLISIIGAHTDQSLWRHL